MSTPFSLRAELKGVEVAPRVILRYLRIPVIVIGHSSRR